MLRINAIAAGMAGVRYLLRATGCAEHDHAQHSREASSAGAEYLLKGAEIGEPDGTWTGRGLEMINLKHGAKVTAEQMRAVYGRLEHWETGDRLGRRPRAATDVQARLDAALAREPEASEERRAEIRREITAHQSVGRGYYDLTFSTVKSISVYEAALREAGETAKADAVAAARVQAVEEALAFLQDHVTTTRVGSHTTITMDDGRRRTVGQYGEISGFVATIWSHATSRAGDPHGHVHCAVLNRVQGKDGKIYALDGQQFKALKGAADVLFERRVEHLVNDATGAVFAWRPDGKAREIVGIDPVLCDESSERGRDVARRLNALVKEFREQHGREPGRQAMAAMRRQAWAAGRQAKSMLSPAALAERYGRKHGEKRLAAQVEAVAEAAKKAHEHGLPAGQPQFANEDALLREAVRRTQELHATWDETALALEINKLLGEVSWGSTGTAQEIMRLVERAVAIDGPADVVALVARERFRVPAALREGQRADGQPIYRAAAGVRYSTREHLASEKVLVAEARERSARQIDVDLIATIRAELEAEGLSPDQLAAVMGILTSGACADVLIGPAGTGKSTTVAQLDRIWRARIGAPVIGLATSQRATDVLEEEGLQALNTAMFLARYMPADGSPAREKLPEGTMIVVDEAGMADTDKLAKIAKLVREAHGKILYTGDQEQLSAVGTGGLLRLLTRDGTPFQLEQVWRFRNTWERAASLKFRDGDVSAIAEYERHGRLRGGDKVAMSEAAVRGYLTDVVDGRTSVLVVKSNEDAALLSARVRDELVALGRVEAETLADLRDGTSCGVGDLIQARLNVHRLDSENGRMLVNRELLRVVGRDERGRLIAERTKDGTRVYLTSTYVDRHVTLAYAGTVHSVQGRTVDTSHSLVQRGMSRNAVYVQATRGREANYLYEVTEVVGDEHEPESYSVSASDVLREILEYDGGQVSANETWRAELEMADSLQELGALWTLASAQAMEAAHTKALRTVIGEHGAERILSEEDRGTLMKTLQYAEMAGHDVVGVLEVAKSWVKQPLERAESMADALRWRVDQVLEARANLPVPGKWEHRLQAQVGEVSEYANDLGRAMDARTDMMATAAVFEAPSWAEALVGPRRWTWGHGQVIAWSEKVAAVAAYRELCGIPDEVTTLGPAPSRLREPVKNVAWHRAWEALGCPEELVDSQRASDEELRERVAQWQREQDWAPAYVAPQLEDALTLAEEFRREGIARWADAEAEAAAGDGEVTGELNELVERAERAERLQAQFDEAAQRYALLHEARERWVAHTAEVAERARLAREELERREQPDQEPVPEPEQAPLIDEAGLATTDYAQEAAAEWSTLGVEGELEPVDQPTVLAPRCAPVLDVVDAEVVEDEPPLPEAPPAAAEPVEAEAVEAEARDVEPEAAGQEVQAPSDATPPAAEVDAEVDAAPSGPSTDLVVDVAQGEPVEGEGVSDLAPECEVEPQVVDARIVSDQELAEAEAEAAKAAAEAAAHAEALVQAEAEARAKSGDYGTKHHLDELAAADDSFVKPAEPEEPEQLALFEIEDDVPARVGESPVAEGSDLTLREAETKARAAREKLLRAALESERREEALRELEEERARQEREREERAQRLAREAAEARRERDRGPGRWSEPSIGGRLW